MQIVVSGSSHAWGVMLTIKCSQGKAAAVSDIDYAKLSVHKWYASQSKSGVWYATSGKGVAMHRMVMRAKKGQIVDHIDGNGLNNRRENLRFVTHEQNAANSRVRAVRPGYLRGIERTKEGYRAVIRHRGQAIYGPSFTRRIDAAKDYDRIKIMLHGEYACTNETQNLYDAIAPDERLADRAELDAERKADQEKRRQYVKQLRGQQP